ncbi:MAG: FliM/FliN family flagellar motor switch protein [Terriglobia bacterium]
MNPTDASGITPQAREYLDVWATALSEGINLIHGAPVSAQAIKAGDSTAPAPEGTAGGLWIRLFGGKAGEQAFFLTTPDAMQLQKLLRGGAPAEADGLDADGQQSLVQFFQQIATMIPMGEWLGFPCELEASGVEKIGWESDARCAYQFSTPEGPLFVLSAWLSADFVSALRPIQRAPEAPAAERSTPRRDGSSMGQARDLNLDLLKEVELEATLRFGQRQMLLGDILNLAPGSVVELDQQVQDPVELLVGDTVIAWGEVVTVDGNYGLRVTGLASREARLDSLRK